MILPAGSSRPHPPAEPSTSAAPTEVEERGVDGEVRQDGGFCLGSAPFEVFLQGKTSGLRLEYLAGSRRRESLRRC